MPALWRSACRGGATRTRSLPPPPRRAVRSVRLASHTPLSERGVATEQCHTPACYVISRSASSAVKLDSIRLQPSSPYRG